jgi:hypothetical protein
MNAPKNIDKEPAQTPIFDPFPEPQTMPKGWDVSGLISSENLSVGSEPNFEAESSYRYPGFIYD